jgi:phosphoribosyl 1,2-cyclic phosphate phosphodiesterase
VTAYKQNSHQKMALHLVRRLADKPIHIIRRLKEMILTFLGTSAANAYPEAFCRCNNCEQARMLGEKSIRKRSAALVNDDLLIDLGPDIMTASNIHNCSLSNVSFCLQTHAHADHLDTSHFLSRSPGYGVVGAPRLHFYASPGALRQAAQLLAQDCSPSGFLDPKIGERLNLEVHPINPLQSIEMGSYLVTAFSANHDPYVESLLYAVQSNGRAFFYGTDTAALPEETWQAFHKNKLNFDLIILDHTYGPDELGSDHLRRFHAEGLLTPVARAFATHIAHQGNPPHPQLSEFARQNGYEIAYDGLILEI